MSLIATGGYSKVFFSNDKKSVSKKITLVSYDEKEDYTEIEYTTIRELAFLGLFKHPNIVSKISQKIEGDIPSQVDLVLPHKGITLSKWASKTTMEYRAKHIPFIAFQILKALYYLEINNVVHADIKPSNILIDPKTKHITLIDFGGCLFNPSESNSFVWCSTRGFRPPEHLKKSGFKYVVNSRNDVFSFGLSMFSCFFNKNPKDKYVPVKKYDILQSFSKDIDDLCYFPDIEILKILYSCLNVNNSKRPKASELYYLDYFSKFREQDTFKYEPVKMNINVNIIDSNEEYKEEMIRTIKKFCSAYNLQDMYCHSILLLDQVLSKIDMSDIQDQEEIKYISILCIHLSYLLLVNTEKCKEDIFYNYDDYNIYYIDILNKVLTELDGNTYIKFL